MLLIRRSVALIVLIAMTAAGTAHAQPLPIHRSDDHTITLEFVKAAFSNWLDTTAGTATWFLSGRFGLNDVVVLSTEIPFSRAAFDDPDFDGPSYEESSTTLGNVYMGVELHSRDTGVYGELGFRLPAADENEDATATGGLASLVDRAEAFATS